MHDWRGTFRAVWVANLVTSLGMMSFLPFFPGYLRELGVSDERAVAVWAGAIYGAAPLTAGIMMPIWGAVGDRFGRKAMVLRSMLAITVFVGAMGHVASPLALFLLRIGQGFFSGFAAPSVTLVSLHVPAERQGRVSGALQSAMAVGSFGGPLLGGVLASAFGVRGVFFWVSAAAFVSAAIVLVFAREAPSAPPEPESHGTGALGALQEVARDAGRAFAEPGLRGPLVLLFAIQLGLGATHPQLESFVGALLASDGGSATAELLGRLFAREEGIRLVRLATSVLFSGMALVSIFAMPLWGRVGDRRGHRASLGACAVLSAGGMAAHVFVPNYGALLLVHVALGAAVAGLGPLAFGIAAGEIAAARRGGAFGAVVSARTLAVSLGAIVGGALAAAIGIRGLYALGALAAIAAIALLNTRGSRRRRPRPESSSAGAAPR